MAAHAKRLGQAAQPGWRDRLLYFARSSRSAFHGNRHLKSRALRGCAAALGLGSRLIGPVLTGNMFMAYVTADREALLSVFSDPGKFYNADPFTFLMASLLVFVFGAGYFSVDRVLQAIRNSKLPSPDGETVGQRAIVTAS